MFAGIISKEQSVSAWGDADKILAALAPYSLDKPRDCWATDKLLLLQVATRNDATSAEIYRHTESGVVVAFWGRLDNRPDLIAQLDAEHKASDDELIALAWLKWGEHCPEKLIGDFALAVVSPRAGTIFLARDVMGVKPLYYRADGHGVFFANSAAAFKPIKLGALTRSREWMARYLVDLSWSHTSTAYEEILKLPCAHSILIQADGRMNLRRYHQFIDDAPMEKTRDPKYLEAYRATWHEAVACRMPSSGSIGTENSGGLDSGSITAELARQLGDGKDRLHGLGFCHETLEPEYIMATAMKYAMKNTHLFSNNPVLDLNEMYRHEHFVHGFPAEQIDSTIHVPVYEYCQKMNISTLFSGFGGDEVVTNPAGIPIRLELWDCGEWLCLWGILPGPWPMRAARFAKTAWLSRNMPDFNVNLMRAWKVRWPYQFLRKGILDQYNLENEYFAKATYDEGFRKINMAAIYLLSRSYAPTRLDNFTLMAASYGVDYVWPLWDQRLVQQWLSTPVIWKLGPRGINRFLHRSAVDDVSARKVTWKGNKNMGNDSDVSSSDTNNGILFNRLCQLGQQLPPELADLVDALKVNAIAESEVKTNLIAPECITAIQSNVYQLENMKRWLQSTKL